MHPETQQVLAFLKVAMTVFGLSARELERRLDLSPGYLSRLLAGKVELKVDHVCAIAQAMGVEPADIFHLALPLRRQPSEAAKRLRETFLRAPGAEAVYGPLADVARPGSSPQDMEQLLEKTLRRLFREMGSRGETD